MLHMSLSFNTTNKMLSLHLAYRCINNSFNQSTKQLYTSVKLLNANDSSSSDSSDSDSDSAKVKKNKKTENSNKSDKTIDLLSSLMNKKYNAPPQHTKSTNINESNKSNTLLSLMDKKYSVNSNTNNLNKQKKKHTVQSNINNVYKQNKNVDNIVLKDFDRFFPEEPKKQTNEQNTEISKNVEFAFQKKKKVKKEKEQIFDFEKSLESAAISVAEAVKDIDKNIESELLSNIKQMKINSVKSSIDSISKLKDESDVGGYFIKEREEKSFALENNRVLVNRLKFLNSLTEIKKNKKLPSLPTWEMLEKKELKMKSIFIPQNCFQELIKWTQEGKLWHFPINNEQGLEEEQKVHFSEHIFLERHIKDWCPTKGPLRHFMELVCVGLSKNAFMTVEEKRGHLMWYRNYFEDKKEIFEKLKDADASDTVVSNNLKQIQASN